MNKKAYLSIEEIISLPTVSSTNISEDGKNVAFVKKTVNWKDNTYRNNLWIYDKDKGQSIPLTTGGLESTSPLWAPDSNEIAYLCSVGEDGHKKNQIFVTTKGGSGGVQITNEKEGVSKFKWEPTGKGFYYVAQSKEDVTIKKRNELYGDFQHIGNEYQNNCLYYIEKTIPQDSFEHEETFAEQLTDGKEFHIYDFDISSDGKKVVFTAAPSSNMQDYINIELYILDRLAGNLEKLNIDRLLGVNVCFSPDGNKICYSASTREKHHYKTYIQDRTLVIVDMNNGEDFLPISEIDSTVTPLRWTAKGILTKWQNKTSYVIGLLADNGTVEMLCDKDSFIMDASITRDGNHHSYSKAITNEIFEIYLDDNKITNENGFFEEKLKSNREIITWHSTDGFEIEGVLSTPVEFKANKKYPLLVVLHGGPAWASFPIFSDCFNEKYPIEQFIEKGFIVLEPNYRGSSGYGNEFLQANYRKLGMADYGDVIAGVDHLIDKGIADKDRVGVMGWSYGGYLSAFCSTTSNKFKAVSVGGAITNWSTYYANTDIPYFIKMHLGNDPWNDPEIYMKTSPMTYIKSACTPTLIQHGEKDVRIPTPNAYELYRGLRDMKVDTELIIFKGMAYSPDQPGMKVAIMKQNLMWFSHYILGESMKDLSVL
ncbi:S9 family peptidase [Sporosarcina sp. Te-1]|uniref:S9 family peptidase n=1 Tax=Sporosarcina sp. Te-1 TaxID=2818390 RepID=UPI001A9D33D7|nr:S9 family peptidase [Sporosarcina sp. Te-1]QTD41813.1 S9 family peptidase [Sporosarcina sp. Te-1]